jgi:hypothetical protein
MSLHQHLPKGRGGTPRATPKAPILKAPGAGSAGGHDRTKDKQQQGVPAVLGDENHPIVIKAGADGHKEQDKLAKTPKPRKQR